MQFRFYQCIEVYIYRDTHTHIYIYIYVYSHLFVTIIEIFLVNIPFSSIQVSVVWAIHFFIYFFLTKYFNWLFNCDITVKIKIKIKTLMRQYNFCQMVFSVVMIWCWFSRQLHCLFSLNNWVRNNVAQSIKM